MTAPLPVVAEAYKRLIRPPEDTYGIFNEPQREEARQYAAKAETMALQSCAHFPNSETLLSQDLIFTISKDNIFGRQPYAIFESETNNVIFEAVKENLERFLMVVDQTTVRTITASTSAATNLFSATMYCATTDSATTKQPIEDRCAWLKVVYDFVRLGQTSKALRVIYASVENHFKREDLTGLGEVLAGADLSRLNPQTMTALLRISGRAKRALPSWHALLQRTRAELTRLNVPDLPGLMVGLGG